ICAGLSVRFLDVAAIGLRFWRRQWHVAACRDHVEFARKEHREAARMTNTTGERAGSSPAPQYRSARAGPTTADPVSCAIISRLKADTTFTLSIGRLASMKNGVPYSCSRSTAMERPGVNGTPCAPTGSPSFDSPVTRKNT